jgi:hypothetical protein
VTIKKYPRKRLAIFALPRAASREFRPIRRQDATPRGGSFVRLETLP